MKVEDGLALSSFESTFIRTERSFCSKLWYFCKLMMFGVLVSVVLTLLLVFVTSDKKGAVNSLPRFSLIVQRKYVDGCLNDGLYGSERACNEYYRCENRIPIPHTCDYGLEWSSLNNSCVSRQESDCAKMFFCPNSFGRFRNELHCDTFYACYFNQPYLIYCPPPFLFSSNTNGCEWPEDSDCPPPKPIITTTTAATTIASTTDSPTTSVTSSTEISQTTTTQTNVTNTTEKEFVFECPEPEGVFADSTDCHSYYFCKDNVSTRYQCSGEKGYNSKHRSCNEPADSDCADQEN